MRSVVPRRRTLHHFASPDDAFAVYIDRVKEQGLALNTEQGRRGWERAAYSCSEEHVECGERDAGFVNSDGYANYRSVMGAIYIGVLGTRDDIEELRVWAWESREECPPAPDTCAVPESQSLYCDGSRVAADASCIEPVSSAGLTMERQSGLAVAGQPIRIIFLLTNSSAPKRPSSRPEPERLTPPKGSSAPSASTTFTNTMPASMPSATRRACAASVV